MLSMKEQTEAYKLGLMIGYFDADEVILWADNIILNSENPGLGVIAVSFSGSKGINEIITQIDTIEGEINHITPVKTILGLLYKNLICRDTPVSKIAEKLYILSQYVPENSLDSRKLRRINALEDIFEIFGTDSAFEQIVDLLKEYETFAYFFNKHCRYRND